MQQISVRYCLITILLVCGKITCFNKYKIIFDNTEFVRECQRNPQANISEYVDTSHLNGTLLPNGNLYVTGYTDLINDLAVPLEMNMQFYKKVRGVWVNTVFNIHKDDFCATLLDKNTFWGKATKSITSDEPLCPLRKGVNITKLWKFDKATIVNMVTGQN